MLLTCIYKDLGNVQKIFNNPMYCCCFNHFLLLLLLLLGGPQLTPNGSLSPANPVIHRCWQAVSADPGSTSSISTNVRACPLMLLLPCFSSHKTKSLTTSFLLLQQWPLKLKAPLSNCSWDPRYSCIKHLTCNAVPPGHILHHFQYFWICTFVYLSLK